MAIYHLSLKNVQRSKGRSATAASAYRSRAKITDERTGQIYDYTRKKGVEFKAIFTPDGSKISREELWNLAEAAERRKDGITAREYELALPSELDQEQREKLTKNFCFMLARRYGVAGDIAIHQPTKEGDQRNFHAHILITTRRFKNGQLGEKTDFDLSGRDRQKKGLKSQKEELENIRQEWERMVNYSLEQAGRPERVSRKRLEEQGISRPATVHLGVAATAMERKGIQTDRGDLNRWPILRKLYTELAQVKKEMRAMEANIAQMRSHEEIKDGRKTTGNSQDERPEERTTATNKGRKPAISTTIKAPEKTSRPNFPAPTANDGSKGAIQPNQIPAGRAEESSKNTGRTGEHNQGTAREFGHAPERPERRHNDFGESLRSSGRITGKRTPRGLPGSADSGRKNTCDRGRTGEHLGCNRTTAKSQWTERLAELEARIIKLTEEYKTIADLLAMNEQAGADHGQQENYLPGIGKP